MKTIALFGALFAFGISGAASWISTNGPGRLKSVAPPGITNLQQIGDRLFAMADSGLFVSTDDAKSWSRSDSGLPRVVIREIRKGDSLFFIRTDGNIYASEDGRNWSSLGLGLAPVDLMAVAGRSLYLAVGGATQDLEGDTVQNSQPPGLYKAEIQDGSWNAKSIGIESDLNSLVFLKGSLFIVKKVDNFALRTENDGAIWTNLMSPAGSPQFLIHGDESRLYASVNARFEATRFFTSIDSGASWAQLPPILSFDIPYDAPMAYQVLDSGLIMYGSGGRGREYVSFLSVGGQNWSGRVESSQIAAGTPRKTFLFDRKNERILLSRDSGKAWSTQGSYLSLDSVLSIAAENGKVCLATPYVTGRYLCSVDGGRSWVETENSAEWRHVMDDEAGNIYVSGPFNGGWRGPKGDRCLLGVARNDSTTWVGCNGAEILLQKNGLESTTLNKGLIASEGFALKLYRDRLIFSTEAGVFRIYSDDSVWAPANPDNPSRVVSLATDGKRLFGVIAGRVYTSPDEGTTWEATDPLPGNVAVTCLASDRDTLYLGTSAGLWAASMAEFPIPAGIERPGKIGEAREQGITHAAPALIRIRWEWRGPVKFTRPGDGRLFGLDGRYQPSIGTR